MTQTPAPVGPGRALPVGPAVGMAERTLTKLLDGVLARTGTSRQTYLALQRLSALGDDVSLDRYVDDLGFWFDLDLWNAGQVADGLVADGLVAVSDGTVTLTASGADLQAKVRAGASEVTAGLYGAIDPGDLETTVRTLQEITARAQALV
jgi:hypothetical protein